MYTALRGHWIKVTFTAKIDGKSLEEVKKAYQTIKPDDVEERAEENKGNAPVVSAEEHTGIPNDASYTIGVGNMAEVYGDRSNTVTVCPEEPELEKYINKNVHEFVELDEVFTYDIIAYLPLDADKAIISDDLNAQLQFAKSGANVKVYDLGTDNNHKTVDKAAQDSVTATVDTGSDMDITDQAEITTNGQSLEVILDNKVTVSGDTISRASDVVTNLRGHYVRVEFKAQLADGVNPVGLDIVSITDNTPLDVTSAQAAHEGVENKSRYTVEVGNKGLYSCESNTVTVIPEDKKVSIPVTKVWVDNNNEAGIRLDAVQIQLYADGEGVGEPLVLNEGIEWKGSFNDLPFYNEQGNEILYTIEEVDSGEYEVSITGDQTAGYTVCNTYAPEKPEIEKFVNQAMHQGIKLDDIFVYDIVSYITKDADSVVITDMLNDDLAFAGTADQIKVADLGTQNNHKVTNDKTGKKVNTDATVAGTGTPLGADVMQAAIEDNLLSVEIYDTEGLRGHWVKVTFACRIKEGKTLDDLKYSTVKPAEIYNDPISKGARDLPNVGNAPVISSEEHTGVPNTASYEIGVGGEIRYKDTSNTVTVDPREKT